MFLLNKNEDKCLLAISKMASSLEGIECSPIQIFSINDHTLGWSRCKQYENLHQFKDGYYLGKLKFTEEACENIIIHEREIRQEEIPPLTNGTIIYINDGRLIVEPLNVTNIYYSNDSVSDMQLLIADSEGYLPSHEGVAILSSVGYLPGNITLFNEIKKIPLLFSYDLHDHLVKQHNHIKYHEPDDNLLIRRLQSIAPDHPNQYLSLTGGKDSRFVFGILNSVGIKPTIVNVQDNETGIVEELAESLKCRLIKIPPAKAYLNPKIYTLATDAQIYASGSTFSLMLPFLHKDALFQTGLFANVILKDGFKSAVKMPGLKRNVYDKCIKMLLSRAKKLQNDLCSFNIYKQLFNYLKEELDFGKKYLNYSTKKEWANWFHYINTGVRWGNAVTMDLSYFSHVVFLLSDLEAVSYGISSKMWDNFAYERVVRLNELVLPNIKTPFATQVKLSNNRLIKAYQKIEFEYFHRFLRMVGDKKVFLTQSKKDLNVSNFILEDPRYFSKYFCKNLNDLLKSDSSYSLKRAAITIAYVLDYLEK